MDPISPWSPYCGTAPLPAELLWRWNLDPIVLILLATAILANRLLTTCSVQSPEQKIAVPLVLVIVFILFVSPFCALSSALFSVRVMHHIVLTSVAAPLLIFAIPAPKYRSIHFGFAAACAHAVIFWLWHLPPLYEAALASSAIYWSMQITLAGSAAMLWLGIRIAPKPIAIVLLLLTMMQMGLLGALLTLAQAPLYAPHLMTTEAWGMSPLTDQQLAGAVMWVGGSAIYLAAALMILWRLVGKKQPALKC